MWRLVAIGAALAGLAMGQAACEDTDVPGARSEPAAEQTGESSALDREVEPVDLENTRWFRESGVVQFQSQSWIVAGEPVWDPMVEQVGEYQGTPLYAEVGVTPPYRRLYIPLENDYWQIFEPVDEPDEVPGAGEDVPEGVPGIDPVGDPRT